MKSSKSYDEILGRNMILETSKGMRLKPLANKQGIKTQPFLWEISWIRFIWIKIIHLLVSASIKIDLNSNMFILMVCGAR